MNLNHPAIRTAELTCIACPEVWEGILTDGYDFRLRYRGGWASLTVSNGVVHGEPVGEQVGDSLAGIFDSDEQRNGVFARLYARIAA